MKNIKLVCFEKLPSRIQYCKEGYVDFIIDQNAEQLGFQSLQNMNEWIYYDNKKTTEIRTPLQIYVKENL